MREAEFQTGKTALSDLVASLRPKPAKPLVRFEGFVPECRQPDFGEVEVQFLNRSSELFALPRSGLDEVVGGR